MRTLKLTVIFILLVVLSGCSASGQSFKQSKKVAKDVATIYVYRPFLTYNMAGWPDIYINGEKKFSLINSGYGVFQLSPGNYEIEAKGSKQATNWFPKPVSFKFDFVAGKEYFVRVLPKFTEEMSIGNVVAVNGSAQIAIVPKKAALKEISKTKRVN